MPKADAPVKDLYVTEKERERERIFASCKLYARINWPLQMTPGKDKWVKYYPFPLQFKWNSSVLHLGSRKEKWIDRGNNKLVARVERRETDNFLDLMFLPNCLTLSSTDHWSSILLTLQPLSVCQSIISLPRKARARRWRQRGREWDSLSLSLSLSLPSFLGETKKEEPSSFALWAISICNN